jgi:hypothetical protein
MHAGGPPAQRPQELEWADQQGDTGRNDVHSQAEHRGEVVGGHLGRHEREAGRNHRHRVAADEHRQDGDDNPADPTTISTPAAAAPPHDWAGDYARFAAADQQAPLDAEDLERWAVAAHLIGEDDQLVALRDRAYREYLDRGLTEQAARCVFWNGFHLDDAGQHAQAAGGWTIFVAHSWPTPVYRKARTQPRTPGPGTTSRAVPIQRGNISSF